MTREQMIAWLTLEGWEFCKTCPSGVAGIRKQGRRALAVALAGDRVYESEVDWFERGINNGEKFATIEELTALVHAVEHGPNC